VGELKSILADEKISYCVLSHKEDLEKLGSARALIIELFDTSLR
jgi:hypothetical protein